MSLPPSDVSLAYQLILGRTASEEEVTQTAAQLDTLADLRTTFLASEEFAKKYARLREQIEGGTPTLVHLHIPKTAGTTLAEALSAEPGLQPYKIVHDDTLDELRAMPRAQRRALRYIRGHLSMGAGDVLGTPYRYLCMIRRPGPRIFSFYQFVRRTRTHPAFQLLTEKDMSFGDYLEWSVDSVPHRLELDNGQIRRLAGRFNAQSIGQETDLLKSALHAALSPDMVFGFVEHFDAFAAELIAQGYLSRGDLQPANVSPNSDQYDGALDALTEGQREIFDGYIAWDTYFYDVAQALLLSETAPETRSPAP